MYRRSHYIGQVSAAIYAYDVWVCAANRNISARAVKIAEAFGNLTKFNLTDEEHSSITKIIARANELAESIRTREGTELAANDLIEAYDLWNVNMDKVA